MNKGFHIRIRILEEQQNTCAKRIEKLYLYRFRKYGRKL